MFPFFFFFNDTATTEIYTLSLHDALPISDGTNIDYIIGQRQGSLGPYVKAHKIFKCPTDRSMTKLADRSEEHTSELQSRLHLVCRLLLEKKKTDPTRYWQSYDPASNDAVR